ncbi:hypothetical protein BO70DRAFT_388832 [Aspergillus heteromorphus CBS 117.55]|uniref:Uncharacterized protein n=1 Tax=Aspergillus heteromorphus CBS 117.55 TaxID=1448321 RepID=A0A317VQ89_9EURO|nr:uncharacterized protein BO70DRAFT_388832 [Aspergillus heteromorphus CBS 117.55]PWY75058.1 hypothetical protein BO70DRAFT_388832 [Aspergillus heteromorphus CBS 117.55]
MDLLLLLFLLLLPLTSAQPNFTFNHLWSLTTHFWDNFLYPANLAHISDNDTSIFTASVQGRVDVTRTFTSRDLNNEYIFGLFSQPNHPGLFGIPIDYNITQFAATQDTVACTAVITFNITTFDLVAPGVITAWFQFSSTGRIAQYDAVFRWLDFLFVPIMQAAGRKFNVSDHALIQSRVADLLARTICETHERYCLGANRQYPSMEACYVFLTRDIRFGQPYEMGRNTLLCREVHDNMVRYNPDVHCPHIGPTGGAYCVDDQTYQEVVLERYFRESWVPENYAEDNVWVAL